MCTITAMELRDDDREVFGLAEFVLLVGDEATLLFRQAKEFGDRVVKEGFGDVFFVEGEVVLEMVAEGFFVLLVAFTGETFHEAAVGEGLAGKTSQLRNGLAAAGDCDKMSASSEKPHGDFQLTENPRPAGINGEEFRVESPIVDHDR